MLCDQLAFVVICGPPFRFGICFLSCLCHDFDGLSVDHVCGIVLILRITTLACSNSLCLKSSAFCSLMLMF